MLIAGFHSRTEKTATIISGTDVITARITNPAEVSLKPVTAINFSIDFIVKWLAEARITNEMAIISN